VRPGQFEDFQKLNEPCKSVQFTQLTYWHNQLKQNQGKTLAMDHWEKNLHCTRSQNVQLGSCNKQLTCDCAVDLCSILQLNCDSLMTELHQKPTMKNTKKIRTFFLEHYTVTQGT
jgi:hypothetical protein